MQCTSYCAGESYDLAAISEYCTKLNWAHKIYGNDVLHIEVGEHLDIETANKGDMFFFNYGCLISWGMDANFEEKILSKMKPFLLTPLAEYVTDRCYYTISSEQDTCCDEEKDMIILNSDDPQIKLAFSYGFSQSVKLSVFETSVENTINENKKIPHELVQSGKISLSRKELAKKIGILFVERNFINLNSNILDTPDFFWRRPRYEPYYVMSINFLDIKPRIEILNSRLNIIHELYDILSNKLHHIHSSRLEMIIVCLIFIEVVLVILRDLLHIL